VKARENAINSYKLDKSKAHYGYNLYVFESVYETVKDVDGIIIATEYDFNKEDWEKIGDLVKERVIFDGRNILNEEKVKSLGFWIYGGRDTINWQFLFNFRLWWIKPSGL